MRTSRREDSNKGVLKENRKKRREERKERKKRRQRRREKKREEKRREEERRREKRETKNTKLCLLHWRVVNDVDELRDDSRVVHTGLQSEASRM